MFNASKSFPLINIAAEQRGLFSRGGLERRRRRKFDFGEGEDSLS